MAHGDGTEGQQRATRLGTKPAPSSSSALLCSALHWVWSKSRPEGVHGKHNRQTHTHPHTPTTSLLRCLNPNCTKFTSFTWSEVDGVQESSARGVEGGPQSENTTYSVQHLISELHCRMAKEKYGSSKWHRGVAPSGAGNGL